MNLRVILNNSYKKNENILLIKLKKNKMNNNNINILITLNHKFPELICNKIIDYKINYDIIDILYFINVNYIVIKELIQENSKIKKKIKKIELDLMSKNKSSNDFKSLTIKNERLK